MILKNGKTYGTTGIQLGLLDSAIIANEGKKPTIRLMDGANNHVIRGDDCVHPVVKHIIIDGNKENQTIGAGFNNRGLYLLGNTEKQDFEDVIIKNTVDHGLFFSTGSTAGKYGTVRRCYAIDCGVQAHQNAGGAGGSGFVGGHESIVWDACFATGNLLNGFKTTGKHIACYSNDNIGGGYESGFGTSAKNFTQYQNCTALDNGGGGMRHQGEIDNLLMSGCIIGGNGNAGITLINNMEKPNITGCQIFNNGQNGYTDTLNSGNAGIYITATSGEVSDFLIDNNHFYDDQVTKTQTHHIQVFQYATGKIGGMNNYGPALISPVSYAAAQFDADIDIEQGRGMSTKVTDLNQHSVTGNTTPEVSTQLTIDARSTPKNMITPFRVTGDAVGTSGDKRIRLKIGSTSKVALSIPSTDDSQWEITGTLERLTSSSARLSYKSKTAGGASSNGVITVSDPFSGSLYMSVELQVLDASDTLTQSRFGLG